MGNQIKKIIFAVLFSAGILLTLSCGSSQITPNYSAEDRFRQGKEKFRSGDYLEAISDFDVIKMQYPGSGVADSAQFYLGECHFQRGEFLLAAEEYQTLKRSMPASGLVPSAQYKIALCFYNLSPKAPLDQKYVTRAIDEFQTFIEYYPKDEQVSDAEAKIKELNDRIAQRLYETAGMYMTMEYFKSAAIYYNNIVEKYFDTPYAEPALLGKVKALVSRKRYDDAKKDIEKFFDKYPNSSHKQEAQSLRDDINDHLKIKSAAIDVVIPEFPDETNA